MYKLSEQDSVAILNPKNEWLECPYWPQSIERDTSQLQIDTLRWTNVTFIYGKNLLFWMLESHNATFLLKKNHNTLQHSRFRLLLQAKGTTIENSCFWVRRQNQTTDQSKEMMCQLFPLYKVLEIGQYPRITEWVGNVLFFAVNRGQFSRKANASLQYCLSGSADSR